MENKNILICLEKMDIGGVETAVLNYAIEMKRRGNNVFVLAQNGIYCDELLKNDIHYINFNFKIEEKFNIDKIKQIKELIEKEKITQVHIHQYPCMLTVCPACILNNTPYIIYIHTTVPHEAYEWFYEAYPIYKYTCKTFFENAQKILGISQKSIQNHIEYFNEKEDKKYMVLPNSLNFKKYTTNTQIKSLTNFLIISRFANEKMQHIINGIDLFIKYIKDNNIQNAKLDIIGNGQTKPEIKAYIENTGYEKYINLLNETNSVEKIMDNYDVVIGIGRCILEAIALKKVAVLSGVDCLKGIIATENIQTAMEGNFVGKNMNNVDTDYVIKQLLELSNNINKTKEILEYNYDVIYNNRNIEKNIFILDEKEEQLYSNITFNIFDTINKMLEDLKSKKKEAEEIWERKVYLENESDLKNAEIEKLKLEQEELKKQKEAIEEELQKIKESNVYKLYKKIF